MGELKGRIIKGIAGFYYVKPDGSGALYECRAKGSFRNESIRPLVGDAVYISVIDADKCKGNITRIMDRKNSLIRPAVANIDQVLLVFAVKSPQPKYGLLERFLILMQHERLPVLLCFHKTDLDDGRQCEELARIYGASGVRLFFTSMEDEETIRELKAALKGKVTAICGPSGVGKSSIINRLQSNVSMQTQEVSRKIQRGKHTTRHVELIGVDDTSYIMDTPGFTSLFVDEIPAGELAVYYPEFQPFISECRYTGCSHVHEPDCGVKGAVAAGQIPKERYESYCSIYEEKKQQERRNFS